MNVNEFHCSKTNLLNLVFGAWDLCRYGGYDESSNNGTSF